MKDLTISPKKSIRDAMKSLNKSAEKCLFVVDKSNRLLGTLTDGDIRRAILSGKDNSESIEKIYFRKPTTIRKENLNISKVKKILVETKLSLVPIINKKNKILNYVTWQQVFGDKKTKTKLNNFAVVIMAGGRGTRLEPFTKVLPKPLVPIKGKPVIEHIIEKFSDYGAKKFYITVNYKSRILKSFFEELRPSYSVKFIDEFQPLGTAGSLRLLKNKIKDPFLVTNCDIIVNADYGDLYAFHKENKFDITLVASTKEYVVPYGICKLNKIGHLLNIQEKPKYNFLANTGLYVINQRVLNVIPKNKLYHITDLISDARKKRMKVGVYPIDDKSWFDIGQWAEYRKTIEKL